MGTRGRDKLGVLTERNCVRGFANPGVEGRKYVDTVGTEVGY